MGSIRTPTPFQHQRPETMKASTFTIAVLLRATLVICPLPRAARADALDHWAPSQVVTNPVGYSGFQLLSCAFGNGRYVAVGQYASDDLGVVETSDDGVVWTMRSPQDYSILDLYDVAFGNGTFVAVGWDYGGWQNLYHSTNGIQWTSHNNNAHNGNFFAVTYGAGKFVAVGDGNGSTGRTNRNIYTSPDGITWTARNSGSPINDVHEIRSIAYGAGVFVAVDSLGYTYTSTTGSTWTRQPQLPGSTSLYSYTGYMNYCNGSFIAQCNTGTNSISADGFSWTPMVKDVTNTFTRVVYAKGVYIGLSGTGVFTSTNGTNWVQRAVQPPPYATRGLAFGTSNVVVVGYSHNPSYPVLPLAYVSDPFVGLVVNPGVSPQLKVSGLQGCAYRIDYLDRLQPLTNNWQPLASFLLTNCPLVWTDTTASNSQRYYRAVLLP